MKKIINASLLVISLCVFSVVHAGEKPKEKKDAPPTEQNKLVHHHGHACESRLIHAPNLIQPGDLRLTNSGNDFDSEAEIREAARVIYHDIAPKLGVVIPNSRITMLTATDMAALSAAAGHPAPHWTDGLAIAGNTEAAAHILEFVVPGTCTHHQFIRDTNSFHETLLVLAHVGGHYDFAENTPYFKMRDPDQIKHSFALAKSLAKYYQEVGYEPVSEFYQHLLSLKYLQDIGRGTFESPETFNTDAGIKKFTSSESVLQAFVHNLPPNAPKWQKELIVDFEKLNRVLPAYVQTKIMNEGWATILEYILLSHTKWSKGHDLVEFAQINSGVTRASFSNPYFMGVQAWLRIRERFFQRPEIEKLNSFEQDKLFIQEAHRIIRQHNDYSFIQYAFDEAWIAKYSLFLHKTLREDEFGSTKQAVTRDAKRVVRLLANKIANRDLHFPKIRIESFNANEEGRILLKHVPILDMPLKMKSMAQALYVLTKISKRPVTLETVGSIFWHPNYQNPRWESFWDGPQWRWKIVKVERPFTFPLRVTVKPNGKVELETGGTPAPEDGLAALGTQHPVFVELKDSLQKELEASIKAYTEDHNLTFGQEYLDERNRKALTNQFLESDSLVAQAASMITHAPTAAEAIDDFVRVKSTRTAKILAEIQKSKRSVKIGKQTISFKALPDIPQFELDHDILNFRKHHLSPTPIDQDPEVDLIGLTTGFFQTAGQSLKKMIPSMSTFGDQSSIPDEDLDIGQGDKQPGDIWEEPGGSGNGDGEADGDGQGDENGSQPGQGSKDPSYAEIPLEDFGRLLAEELELRNLRKTKGGNEKTDTMRLGGEHRPSGNVLWDRTAAEAYSLGLAIAKRQGLNPRKMKRKDIIEIGMKHLSPTDYVVSSQDKFKVPEFDAVIVYIADTSGSMGPAHRKAQLQMVAHERAVLRYFYPKLKEHFIIYDTEAIEVSEKEFFTRGKGGGTDFKPAVDLARKILEEKYPRSRYNRYAQIFSDGDDFSDGHQSLDAAKGLSEEVEYLTYGDVQPSDSVSSPRIGGQLSHMFKDLAEREPEKVAFAKITLEQESILEALKRYFGKNPDQP